MDAIRWEHNTLCLLDQTRLPAAEVWLHCTDYRQAAQAIRNLEEDFACWFIKRHRDRVDDLCCDIAQHLRGANTIWPTYRFEYKDRRGELNQALKWCNKLQDELQYIAESLPADKNKYMDIVLEVEALFNMIKALRQSDNRFLKHLKD